MVHISLSAETIFHIFGFPVTNTLLTAWVVMFFLIMAAYLVRKSVRSVPGKLQNVVEFMIESFLDFMTTVAGSRKDAERFFPIVATVFFFVLFSNWAGILPGVGSIGFYEASHEAVAIEEAVNAHGEEAPVAQDEPTHEKEGTVSDEKPADQEAAAGEGGERVFVPFLRSVNSDLNMTLALALLIVTLSHYFGVAALGAAAHVGKFFNFKNPVNFFVGILEFISEFAKIISFSFRLFGNVFAGEVLLVIITFLVPVIAPVPFYGLEVFVGFIQALIFAVLSMMFLSVAVKHH